MNPCRRARALRQRGAGFAYLWVLLLVAFMGLGLAAATEIYATSVQRDKEQELLGIGRQFRFALGRYYETQLTAGKREYPASLEDLLQDNRSVGVKRHLRKLFVDPMTRDSEWGLLRVGGRIVGVYSLSQAMPIKQDHFEAEDMGFRGKAKYSDWVFTYPSDLLLRGEANAQDMTVVPAGGAAASAAASPSIPASIPSGAADASSGGLKP